VIFNERQLAALASQLIGSRTAIPPAERALIPEDFRFPAPVVAHVRALIEQGEDFLGDVFGSIRPAEERRKRGATYTPKPVVDAMIAWAQEHIDAPSHVVDPGAGSGRFLFGAARAFPRAKLVAVEIDPLATLLIRANAAVLGLAKRVEICAVDYREFKRPRTTGRVLFIGNPPYVRHHEIEPKWKAWLSAAANRLGFTASGLAGLHIHFFVRTREIGRPGDIGSFITAAEWMDVNYGSVLRKMLADGLGGAALHVIDPRAKLFSDAMATGAITCFKIGHRPEQFQIRQVDSLEKLAPLSGGRYIQWSAVEAAPRWSALLRKPKRLKKGEFELGELFRVHRGQVTGCNAVWIAADQAMFLPHRFLLPCITRARDLILAGDTPLDTASVGQLRQVVDLPQDFEQLADDEKEAIKRFLRWARSMGAHKSYIAQHRRAWWAVGLREPAPILCTYMARRAPAFVRNIGGARHINIAHGLYPRAPMPDAAINAVLRHLKDTVTMESGRTYAGGLVKFEPGEVSRLQIADPFSASA
jgi:adenine-specific DNA-methyltransferase